MENDCAGFSGARGWVGTPRSKDSNMKMNHLWLAASSILLVTFVYCAALVPAFARTINSHNTPPMHEVAGSQALKEIKWKWQPIINNWSVRFHAGRQGYLGLTDLENQSIDIWIRQNQTPQEVAATLVHEFVHAFDRLYLTPELRAKWLAARGLSTDTPWFPPCSGCSDYRFGAGDFAESFSWTLQGSVTKFRSHLGPPPKFPASDYSTVAFFGNASKINFLAIVSRF